MDPFMDAIVRFRGGSEGGMTPSLLPTTPYEVEQKGSLTYEELHPVSGATCQSVSPAAS